MDNLEIVEIGKDLTEAEALAAVKDGVELLDLHDVDAILQDDALREKYSDYLPMRTDLYVELDGEEGKFKLGERTWAKKVPLDDGWYKQDEHGFPCGKPSSRSDKDARYLYRRNKWKGLVVRGGGWLDGYYRRYVDCYYRPYNRFGVLGKRVAPEATEENTVEFKSEPEFYAKEESGAKPCTVRVVDDEQDAR